MADFGLAAQIGRGNAMPGAQQQDPQNRMMQMMQLQQLQQNMMLAREQENRAAGLYGLQRQNLETDIEAGRGRLGLIRAQTDSATQAAASAARAGTAEQGVLDYTRTTPQEERANPERLNVLRTTNPGAYTFVVDQINTARALDAKAKAEGFTAEQRQFEMRKVALAGMSSLLPAVRDQDSYETLYRDYRVVDPTGAKLIGPKFTPENVAALSARVQDLGDLDYGKDELGNQIVTNKRTGVVSLLAPAKRPAAPAASQLGNLDASFAANPASPQMIGAGAASLPSPNVMAAPGTTPIIGQRAPVPVAAPTPAAAAPPPGLDPKAAADFQSTRAREIAQAGVKRTEKEIDLAQQLDSAIAEISAAAVPGGLISKSTGSILGNAIDTAAAFIGVATPGAIAIGKLAPIADLGAKLVPRFEGPQSDGDRKSYERASADIANPNVPNAIRIEAANQLVRLMKKRRNEFTLRGDTATSPARSVTRTGMSGGRRVNEYSDGTIEYAD